MKTRKSFTYKRLEVVFQAMNHWGGFHFIPSLELSINYSQPTFIFQWMIFRMDVSVYRRLPDWFMDHIWSVMNFDFIFNDKDDDCD